MQGCVSFYTVIWIIKYVHLYASIFANIQWTVCLCFCFFFSRVILLNNCLQCFFSQHTIYLSLWDRQPLVSIPVIIYLTKKIPSKHLLNNTDWHEFPNWPISWLSLRKVGKFYTLFYILQQTSEASTVEIGSSGHDDQ